MARAVVPGSRRRVVLGEDRGSVRDTVPRSLTAWLTWLTWLTGPDRLLTRKHFHSHLERAYHLRVLIMMQVAPSAPLLHPEQALNRPPKSSPLQRIMHACSPPLATVSFVFPPGWILTTASNLAQVSRL